MYVELLDELSCELTIIVPTSDVYT